MLSPREFTEGQGFKAYARGGVVPTKVFARTDKLYVKRYEQETNLDVVVLIDRSRSMRYGSLGMKAGWGGTDPSRATSRWTKWDHATAITAALAYLCLQQGDRVGVATFTEALATGGRVGVDLASGIGQTRYNNDFSRAQEQYVTGRRSEAEHSGR